jgi:hypothetical protein
VFSKLTRKVGLGLLLGLIFAVSLVVSSARAQQSSPHRPTKDITQRDFGAWKYSVTEQDGVTVVAVELTNKDNNGLKAYMQANSDLASNVFKGQDMVEGRVILKQPLSEDQLPQVIQSARSQVTAYELRVKASGKEKYTIFGAPDADAFLPQGILNHFLDDIKKRGEAKFEGFTTVTMNMDREQFQALAASPHVLFVDIIPAAAIDDFKQSPAAQLVPNTPISTIPVPAYWYHEEVVDP